MVYSVNHTIYGLFHQGTYYLIEKIRCIQMSRLWSRCTQTGDKYGRKEKQDKRLLL